MCSCETVIMHLESNAIMPAVEQLLAILIPGGTLYLSWRVTGGQRIGETSTVGSTRHLIQNWC